MGKWLENQGRQACYFVPTKPSEVFDFLPTITSFQTHIPSQYTPDLRISLDTAERHRSNLAERNTEKPILHIDHHPTDQGRGTINFVNDAVNSTCELVLFLLEQQNTSDITPEIATYLFLGISTDTGHFMWGKDLQN
ncbi:MAG: DHH family phosphoesterase [bacterium]|nr:DHH family phosphoesterase [bacterium]